MQLSNVEAALFAMEEAGCRVDLRGENVVNGVRSTTLSLLWTLIRDFQVSLASPAFHLSTDRHMHVLRLKCASIVQQPAM